MQNQLSLLVYTNKDISIINTIKRKIEQVEENNIIETEAVAAKLYFKQIFGEEFHRFQDDEINSALNYGYAILRGIIKQYLVAKGLHPTLGLWHKNQYNKFNLADDIIEVFRPIVDFVVYHLIIKDCSFTKEERIYLQNTIFQKVYFNNSVLEYKDCVVLYIDEIINYMNRKQKTINMPILDCELYEY